MVCCVINVILPCFTSCPVLNLQLISTESVPPEIRQQGAVQFKNYVKYNWSPIDGEEHLTIRPLDEGEKNQIRSHIVDLMLNAPDKVRAQISEALTIISKHDFPQHWPGLLPSILEKFQTQDIKVLNGVLSTTDSIINRYRGQFLTTELSRELQYCQQMVRPLLCVAQNITSACESLTSVAKGTQGAESAPLTLDNARLVLNIFYSLNSPGLTDEFEETLKEWMDCIHRLLVLNVPCVLSSDPDEQTPLDAAKAIACECLSLFMELNEEEFAEFLETFVGDVWKLLLEVGQGLGQDGLAMAAIAFLTTVARSVHFKLFAGEDILKQVCQGVIIPNIRLREGDVELFEMNWVEYVRRDIEGSDSDTRRRAASELVKALVEKFPSQTTELFSGYVTALLAEAEASPNAWQAKDAAIYLVTALAAKTKTSTAGATTTNELVQLGDFYAAQIAPELSSLQIEDRAIIKADSLRFVTIFRSQLSKEILLGLFPHCVNMLGSTHNVVHSYSAILVERLLAMKSNNTTVFSTAELGPYLQPLLEKLFEALKMPDSSENEYVMKTVMRLVAFVGTSVGPIVVPALTQLAQILGQVARNPTQPGFNHYLFESIAALIKYGTDGSDASCTAVEAVVFPPFQIILREEIQEFHPYTFQIFAELLEIRHMGAPGSPIPDGYTQILQPSLQHEFWERPGNVPALGRLLRAFMLAAPKQTEPFIQGILGVFQKLVASKSQDHEGMMILDYVLACMDAQTMTPYLGSIWAILYQRLQSARTSKFCKSFVSTAGLYAALKGGDAAGESMDSVQPGILPMLVQSVWAPTLATPGLLLNEKAALIGSCKVLCEASSLNHTSADHASASLLHAIAARILNSTSAAAPAEEEELEEFTGYSAAYAKLHFSVGQEKDWVPAVSDAKSEVAHRLVEYNSNSPGRLVRLGQILPKEQQDLVLHLLQTIGISSGA